MAACIACGAPIDDPYRGACADCAARAVAARPDLGPYAESAALFRRAAKIRRVASALGAASLVAWAVQIGSVVVAFSLPYDHQDAMGPILVYGWFGVGVMQIGLAIASGAVFYRVRALCKQIGVAPRERFPPWLLFIAAGLGFVGQVAGGALALFAMALGSMGGAWGRPLRIRRRAVSPTVRASDEWEAGDRPDASAVAALDAGTRAALTALWLHDAKKEHASVPAFAEVGWQLAALGAPADLLRRAHESALQEIDHARRCFALASGYAGAPLGYAAMPELAAGIGSLPRDRMRALAAIARGTLVDGAFIEGFNAALAREGLADVVDPAARSVLERITDDEQEHADLAWDILAWALAEGGPPVARAIRDAASSIGPVAPAPYREEHLGLVALADPAALRAHGRVRPEVWASVYARCREATLARVETMTPEALTRGAARVAA